jgi:hypothetical protein
MKKYVVYITATILVASMASCAPTYVVRERPAEVVYARPPAPSYDHIWITGDWIWEGGRYQWHEGHWERRREGYRWQEGHWQTAKGGYKWVPGHWQG